MCSPEYNVTGVLVANKNKAGTKACTIPEICKGKIVQTTFLDQNKFFGYLSKVCLFYCNLTSYLARLLLSSSVIVDTGTMGVFTTNM